MVRFLQINLQHAKAASAALLTLLAEGGIDIVLIQEPWLNKGLIKGLRTRDFNLIQSACNGRLRVCMLARKNLDIFLLSEYSNADMVVASLEINNKQYWIASVYMAHDNEMPPPGMKTLVEAAEVKNKNLIVGSDANAHHHMWGSTDINYRARNLLNLLCLITFQYVIDVMNRHLLLAIDKKCSMSLLFPNVLGKT